MKRGIGGGGRGEAVNFLYMTYRGRATFLRVDFYVGPKFLTSKFEQNTNFKDRIGADLRLLESFFF